MKTTTIRGSRYEANKTGYGNWSIRKTTRSGKTETRHTTNSEMIDWMDDNSDRRLHANARARLTELFKKEE